MYSPFSSSPPLLRRARDSSFKVSALSSNSARSATPSMKSAEPSRFCLNAIWLLGPPNACAITNPASSSLIIIRSAAKRMVPWVSTTLPSSVRTSLFWSTVATSNSILIGFLRSACSAWAWIADTELMATRAKPTRWRSCLLLMLIVASFQVVDRWHAPAPIKRAS